MAQNQEKLASFMDSLSSTAQYSDELRVIATAYIMEKVAGTQQGSRDLLHRLLQSQRIKVRNGGRALQLLQESMKELISWLT